MPAFDFASGNARKLLSLPLYALGVCASLVVPRRRGRWVFGSGPGIGEGALELYRHVHEQYPDLSITWLARDDSDVTVAAALGVPAVLKASPRGLLRTLRAQVVVLTHGFGDVNRYGTRGAFVVQLWHGVPLKLIQLDTPATMTIGIPGAWRLRGVLRKFYRRGFAAIRMMPAASELVAARLRTAFALGDQVVATGDPRDDVLARTTAMSARSAVADILSLPRDASRLALLAPTWRDGEADPGSPSADEWRQIADWLERADMTLVVRPHPLSVSDYAAGPAASPRVRMLGAGLQADITPLLPAFDLLITDYSSIAFDFSLTGGALFFLAPDEEAYTASRGLYEPYRVYSGGRAVRTWSALLAQLDRFDSDRAWAKTVLEHSATLATTHFTYRDGGNTARVYSEITRKLGH
ncbi:MAG: CDP-glycerol glycerophosphotransferase family protein [Actinomycetota bacterium]